jgi:outer membrane lipoprotein-sorting protein
MRADGRLRLALVVLALWAWPAPATDWTLARLMEALSANKESRAAFNETRFLSLLDRPLESSGELRFTPPRRLEKRTLAPGSETVVVDGDSVVIERAGKRHSLSLKEHPEVAVFVESIRGTLAGDRESLERAYALSLEGDERRWQLVLRPRDDSVARLVAKIEVGGAGADVRRIEITQPDGDRTLMLIRRIAP